MLFVTVWELNENMSDAERLQIAQKLTSSGLFPPKGVNVIRWDGTPDGWGILIAEAENVNDISRALEVWRAAGAGFFKSTRTAPAAPVQEVMSSAAEILKAVGTA
jgi:hypothetical protein